MPKPANLISAFIFTCENVLQDKDNAFSAIRIVDLYAPEAVPPGLTPDGIGIDVKRLFMAKFDGSDGDQYTVNINHIRPDGSKGKLDGIPMTLDSRIEDSRIRVLQQTKLRSE